MPTIRGVLGSTRADEGPFPWHGRHHGEEELYTHARQVPLHVFQHPICTKKKKDFRGILDIIPPVILPRKAGLGRTRMTGIDQPARTLERG